MKRERAVVNEEKILNGGKIRFGEFLYKNISSNVNKDDITKEDIKEYIFNYVNIEITKIKDSSVNRGVLNLGKFRRI